MRAASTPLAPELRIRRRTGGQRRYLARARRSAGTLARGARLGDERLGRAALEARLPALRAGLLRSPFWREVLAAVGLAPGDLRSLADLAHFPTLDRATLAERWRDLPALVPGAAGELVTVASSGSSGRPLTVLRDEYECLHMWAVLRFWSAQLGVALPPRPRVVLLCALPGGLEYSVRLPILDDGALHRISIARGGAERRLRRVRPAVVFSDPAGLHWLAGLPEPPQPRLLLSSAQYLPGELSSRLAATIPVPLVDYYSTTETGPLAWRCGSQGGGFHVLVPEVWVESLGGELVVTRLRSSPLPLLRYRTGDRGTVERDACGCGYRGWSIRGFRGRRACSFTTPDGQPVDAWCLAWLFKHYPLRGFRLTQTGASDFALELAPAPGAPRVADLEDRLRRALQRLGWARPQIAVRIRESIARSGAKPEPFATSRRRVQAARRRGDPPAGY